MCDTFSTEELKEMLRERAQKKDLFFLPNFIDLGIDDLNTTVQNFDTMAQKAKIALEGGWCIEFSTLLSSYIEFYLKMYLIGMKVVDIQTDKILKSTLGNLISRVKPFFESALLLKLEEFLGIRNEITHNLLYGRIAFDQLAQRCWYYKDLADDVLEYVVRKIGKIYSEQLLNDQLGACVIELKKAE